MKEDKNKLIYHPTEQLTLPVRHLIKNNFDSFYGSVNSAVANILKMKVVDGTDQFIFILGPEGSGKTHLLESALSEIESDSQRQGFFLCLKELAAADLTAASCAEFFENLYVYDLIALDNLNSWFSPSNLPLKNKESLLFNLFNECKERNILLVISSRNTVDELNCELLDLASRLKSGLTLRLQPYSETEKIEILKELARNKGLSFNDDVASYIIKRSQRGLKSLIDTLTVLDKESLASQRKLTIPFIKKTLSW